MIAIIPARGGSKSIPDKNIRNFCGMPLLAWSINAASSIGARPVVTTDSKRIAIIAKKYKADVIMRPSSISEDNSEDIEYLQHAHRNIDLGSFFVLLRPSSPFRLEKTLRRAIEAWNNQMKSDPTSLISIEPTDNKVMKSVIISGDFISPIWQDFGEEGYNCPRQQYPKTYYPNGYIDILRTDTIKSGWVYGPRPLPFITEPTIDIDEPNHWADAEGIMKSFNLRRRKKIN